MSDAGQKKRPLEYAFQRARVALPYSLEGGELGNAPQQSTSSSRYTVLKHKRP